MVSPRDSFLRGSAELAAKRAQAERGESVDAQIAAIQARTEREKQDVRDLGAAIAGVLQRRVPYDEVVTKWEGYQSQSNQWVGTKQQLGVWVINRFRAEHTDTDYQSPGVNPHWHTDYTTSLAADGLVYTYTSPDRVEHSAGLDDYQVRARVTETLIEFAQGKGIQASDL